MSDDQSFNQADPEESLGKDSKRNHKAGKFGAFLAKSLGWCLFLPWILWSCGAIWFDLAPSGWSVIATLLFLALILVLAIRFRGGRIAFVSNLVLVVLVTLLWIRQKPQQDRDWKAEVAELPSVEVAGDLVTVHKVRNFDYRMEDDFDIRYETRRVHLSNLQGADLFLNYWGTEWMAHPIVSFDFGSEGRICFSVETRPEKGEVYSALRGLYHGFELICVAADERDIIRLRSNYRKGEDVYLYRVNIESAKEAFLEYINLLDELNEAPQWYNAITKNCTTSLRHQRGREERSEWDWRMLVNGYYDQLLYERKKIDQSLPFVELKQFAHVNKRAIAADQDPDFSTRIREGVPGFGGSSPPSAQEQD